jgi:BirA family transcriptional regulator, biotin operon repressor / biotin---[acetyl-CoA-carboxylase] ligase
MVGSVSWTFRNLGTVTSTQQLADEMAQSGAPQGQVVMATEQILGIGRLGREWRSPPGGLYMSLVLRPVRTSEMQLLPLMGAFSIVEGIRKATGIVSLVRWPNDVTIEGKKVAGVIAETKYQGPVVSHVIVGMGINCNFSAESLGALALNSTTLSDHLGTPVDLDNLRDTTLQSFGMMYSRWENNSDKEIFAERAGWFSTLGKKVEIEMLAGGAKIICTAQRVLEDGSLIATDEQGRPLTIRGEDIQRLREL